MDKQTIIELMCRTHKYGYDQVVPHKTHPSTAGMTEAERHVVRLQMKKLFEVVIEPYMEFRDE